MKSKGLLLLMLDGRAVENVTREGATSSLVAL